MVKKQELSEMVADLAKSGDANEASMAAYTALSRQPPAKAVPALLAVAVKTINVAVRARMLQVITMLRYSGMQEEMSAWGTEASQPAIEAAMKKLAEQNKLSIGTNAAEWKILLADTRLPAERMYFGGTYEWTVADMAAMGIESLYGDTSVMEQYGRRRGTKNLRPDVMMKTTRSRAVARLDGKSEDQLPKMPSADDVTTDRRKAIEVDVVKATSAELGAVLDKLTDAESLYLAEAVGEKLAGTMISTNAIAEMREICKRQLTNGAAFVVTLSSGGLGKGLSLNVTPADEVMQRMYGSGYMSMMSGKGGKKKGMLLGMLMGGQNHGQGMWLVDLPAPVAPTGTVALASSDSEDNSEDRLDSIERSFESQTEQFETAVEAFCKPDEPLGHSHSTSVSFTGLIPSKEKDKEKVSDDEDEGNAEIMDVVE